MRILMLSTDRTIFEEDSPLRLRLAEQAALITQIHVIVFTPQGEQFKKFHVGHHLAVYPTESSGKFAYLPDAYRIGKAILSGRHHKGKWLVSTQDPFETGVLGYVLARKFHHPLHLQLHTDPFSREWKNERLLNRFRFLLAHFLLTHAAGVRVVSERLRRAVEALGVPPSRITRVPIFVDVEHFVTAIPTFDLHRTYGEFEEIILSLGRLEPEKNYHGLIRAFARVRRERPGAMLLIVGSGGERDRLLRLAASLQLGKSVTILPWARDVASYYKTCDLYVQPSFYEGWGLGVIEASASGAPVVMTDVGAAGEVIRNEETGLVVSPGDELALAKAILRLLREKELRSTFAHNAEQEVKKLATKAETLMLYKTSWENAAHS